MIFRTSKSQKIKNYARRTLSSMIPASRKKYVLDTSAIINRFVSDLIIKGLKGTFIIPNAVMAELEHLANKGREEGFKGLEEVTNLRKIHKIKIHFKGSRPSETQIKYAKSGEIDALIRKIASENKSILITADLVQAKSAQAYGLDVIFLKPKTKKKSFFSRIFRQ
jgi:ATPase